MNLKTGSVKNLSYIFSNFLRTFQWNFGGNNQTYLLDLSIERANLDFLHMVFTANLNPVNKLKIGKCSAPYDLWGEILCKFQLHRTINVRKNIS